jgi:hypothetical protein
MDDRGRIVVVTAGFGLWRDGRCLAAGKWSDIARIRAYMVATAAGNAIAAAIELRDGSEVEVREDAPGWATFLNAAPTKLPGMPSPEAWTAELRVSSSASLTLFERVALGA